jgi:hypothetical protein
MGPGHRREDRLLVERAQAAQVEHLGLDALRRELLGRGERLRQGPALGHEAHVEHRNFSGDFVGSEK